MAPQQQQFWPGLLLRKALRRSAKVPTQLKLEEVSTENVYKGIPDTQVVK